MAGQPASGVPPSTELFVLLQQGKLKIGSCEHCVLKEEGRPDRAWNPDGDNELDFDRDALLAKLAALGVQVESVEEFVCP